MCKIALPVETKDIGDVIILFFFLILFNEATAKCKPAEQLLNATAYLDLTILHIFCSNFSISGPCVINLFLNDLLQRQCLFINEIFSVWYIHAITLSII